MRRAGEYGRRQQGFCSHGVDLTRLPLSAAEVHPCFPATVTRHDAPEIGGGRASQGHACGRVYYFQRYPVVKRAQLAPQLPWCASTRAALARALLLEARSSENSSGHLGALQLTAVEEIGYAIIFEWASARTARSYDGLLAAYALAVLK